MDLTDPNDVPVVSSQHEEALPAWERRAPSTFPSDTLKSGRVLGDTATFGRIGAMAKVGPTLLVADDLLSPHLLLVNLKDGSVVSRIGVHGEGPEEFQGITSLGVPTGDPPTVEVFDYQNRRVSQLEILPALEGLRVAGTRPLLFDGTVLAAVRTPSGIVGNGLFLDFTLVSFDEQGRALRRVLGNQPFTTQEIGHPTGRRMLNRNFLAATPEARRLVVVYQFANRLDFFDSNLRRVGSSSGPFESRPSFRVESERFFWNDDNEMAYWSAQGTPSFVYATFCGCKMGEDGRPNTIHVFDWDGNFVRELVLDREILAFTVDEESRSIWGAVEDPYPRIIEWEWPEPEE